MVFTFPHSISYELWSMFTVCGKGPPRLFLAGAVLQLACKRVCPLISWVQPCPGERPTPFKRRKCNLPKPTTSELLALSDGSHVCAMPTLEMRKSLGRQPVQWHPEIHARLGSPKISQEHRGPPRARGFRSFSANH